MEEFIYTEEMRQQDENIERVYNMSEKDREELFKRVEEKFGSDELRWD